MKLGKRKIAVLVIFGLLLGLAIYFFYSPANIEYSGSDTPEYKEMSNNILEYSSSFDNFIEDYNAVSYYGNGITDDGFIEIEELIEFEDLLRDLIIISTDVKKQSDNVEELIDLYSNNFEDPNSLLSNLESNEKIINDNLNNVVIFINLLRSDVIEETHNKILNDLSVELIDIRDS